MHFLLISAAALVDQGFAAYTVSEESFFYGMDDLVMYHIVVWNKYTTVRASLIVTHKKSFHATAALILGVRGVNIKIST